MKRVAKALRELLLARAAGMIDGDEFERRQAALHAELLAENAASGHRRTLIAVAGGIAVLALAIGVYVWKTEATPAPVPAALPPMGMPAASMPTAAPNAGGDLNSMAVRLAEKLAKDPTNGEGWALLGQTYLELRQYKEADRAFARADALGKVDARLRGEWDKARAGMAGK